MMVAPLRAIAALLFCTAVAGAGKAKSGASRAESIVAASKQATGGPAWNRPAGCVERGTHAGGAISYLTRFSLTRYGMRTDSDRGGTVRSMGFDGTSRWQRTGAGKADIQSDPASLQEAIVTDYLSINGFFFPDRFPAAFRYLRSANDHARTFDVVEVAPRGGRPLEIWFDRRTHLIKRVVDIHGTPAVRVEAGDYRRGPDGLTIAYRLDIVSPQGTVLDRGAVTSFRCGSIDTSVFAPPNEALNPSGR
jgi:hypothetical protein